MRKKTTARRLDVKIEYKDRKLIQIIDMACPSDRNINKKKGKITEVMRRSERKDQDTMSRSFQWSLNA